MVKKSNKSFSPTLKIAILIVLAIIIILAVKWAQTTPQLSPSSSSSCDPRSATFDCTSSGSANDGPSTNTLGAGEITEILNAWGDQIKDIIRNGGHNAQFRQTVSDDPSVPGAAAFDDVSDETKQEVKDEAVQDCKDNLATNVQAAKDACENFKKTCVAKNVCTAGGPTEYAGTCGEAACGFFFTMSLRNAVDIDSDKALANPSNYEGTYEYRCTSQSTYCAETCTCDPIKVTTSSGTNNQKISDGSNTNVPFDPNNPEDGGSMLLDEPERYEPAPETV